jgi:hypothetical protein
LPLIIITTSIITIAHLLATSLFLIAALKLVFFLWWAIAILAINSILIGEPIYAIPATFYAAGVESDALAIIPLII